MPFKKGDRVRLIHVCAGWEPLCGDVGTVVGIKAGDYSSRRAHLRDDQVIVRFPRSEYDRTICPPEWLELLPPDPMAGARTRTDDNLRGVFG